MDNLYISNFKENILFKILRFLILLIICDMILGNIGESLYFSQKSGQDYRLTYALEKTNEDIIIFGNSQAARHYVPSIFTNILGMSCYNTGIGGQDLFFSHTVQKTILSRYNPKTMREP